LPVPVCRVAEEAYQSGVRDTLANPEAVPELAGRVAALLAPWLEALTAAQRPRPLFVTVAQAAAQLGLSPRHVYDLVREGELSSLQIPGPTGKRSACRVEQTAIDAFIERHRVQ
jgi:excisionase family DNA binding protein